MGNAKDVFLNGSLLALVIISVGLSSLVWFPTAANQNRFPAPSEAQVQPPPPPAMTRSMPDIFRPDRIVVRRKDGQMAVLQMGAVAHTQLWALAHSILTKVRPTLVSATTGDLTKAGGEEGTVALYLPVPLRLSDWAEQWAWSALGPTNQSVLIDRVSFMLGKEPTIFLSGPAGGNYRLSSFLELDQKKVQDFIAKQVDVREFYRPRELVIKEPPTAEILPGLMVADITSMPAARVRVQKPSEDTEKARFFPDLSVVRAIDEKDARSFTDGQRLLRLTSSGILEFRTTATPGLGLEVRRALTLAKDWVGRHGGWSQDLVMTLHDQEPGRTRLQFDYRITGPHPVESSGGSVRVDFEGERVTYLRRAPDFLEVVFGREQTPIIAPEEALSIAMDNAPLSFFQVVRDIHPAYRVRPGQGTAEPEWLLEPTWVVQVGATRIYVPAAKTLDRRPPIR